MLADADPALLATTGPAEIAPAVPSVIARELARTSDGRLFLQEDPRVGRAVLLELRDHPIDDEQLTQLRAVAASGGPQVQRMLALSPDRRTITYEAITGPALALGALAPADRALLQPSAAALAAAGLDAEALQVVRTDGGLVLLVAPPLPPDV
jgi:hypothetical protein